LRNNEVIRRKCCQES